MKWKGLIPLIRWIMIGEYNHPDDWIDAHLTERAKERAEWLKLAKENEHKEDGLR